MAQIIAYPSADKVSADDCLLGTQKDQGTSNITNPTKNFSVDSVVQAGLGYTAYTALLTQGGVSAPVATVLKNNTEATYTWSRSGIGEYAITANTAVFDATKTLVFGNIGKRPPENVYFRWYVVSNVEISVSTYVAVDGQPGDPVDDAFEKGSFEIRIYL